MWHKYINTDIQIYIRKSVYIYNSSSKGGRVNYIICCVCWVRIIDLRLERLYPGVLRLRNLKICVKQFWHKLKKIYFFWNIFVTNKNRWFFIKFVSKKIFFLKHFCAKNIFYFDKCFKKNIFFETFLWQISKIILFIDFFCQMSLNVHKSSLKLQIKINLVFITTKNTIL